MLDFSQIRRLTVETALAHPFLEEFSDPNDEPTMEVPFARDVVQDGLTSAQLKQLILLETKPEDFQEFRDSNILPEGEDPNEES